MIKIKKDVAISENGFLFDPSTGESFNLNKTGQLIFKLLSENKDPKEIESIVSEKYDIENLNFHRYLDEFVMMLGRYNLTEKEEV